MMGGWTIEYWRRDKKGKETSELAQEDLDHIAEMVRDGCTSGEVNDEERRWTKNKRKST